jgi:Rod binding domain-containing protein
VPSVLSSGFSALNSLPTDNMTGRLIRQPGSPQKEDAKIEKSAKDFESLLLGGWLAQAEQSFAKLPGGDDEEDADAGSDELQGLAMQSLGTSLTEAGGIGLAKMISVQLHKAQHDATILPKKGGVGDTNSL